MATARLNHPQNIRELPARHCTYNTTKHPNSIQSSFEPTEPRL